MQRMCKINLALAALFTVSCLATSAEAALRQRDQQIQIVAADMCCQGCAQKVSSKLYTAKGVRKVGVDLDTRTVTVTLPAPTPAMLGYLWHAVEQSDGGPTRLTTPEATYTLVRREGNANGSNQNQRTAAPITIVIDNLHCQGCAKKIAARLYTLKGVTKVSSDLQKNTLAVETRPGVTISPWAVINAVAKAKERPVAVNGAHGNLTIAWASKTATKNHQAQQPFNQGIQR